MLEIKNLTKIYTTKGGMPTRALDNVNIAFAETGLVFLLGKSGSGKSTLLNVAGGLDEPTQGEVIVMGKSSKDFTGSDFDSYRNTYVGFIFQEYNVLDEFSVEDNVALALELQGKPKDREKITEILRAVELEAYAKRKPNTLSGGQKQRIAIARALVKDPQIIMADEPTGALDSATGKQVFDTLKQLSKDRLVIVVSHDREFAEIYGDRIVELKDGRIISDVVKKRTAPTPLNENVTLIGTDTLQIKGGERLSEENFEAIKHFLSESSGEVILTKGEKEITAFKRVSRLDETGAREHFEDTAEGDVAVKEYAAGDTKFIRSRLPFPKAVRIGASSMKVKPFRLVMTIFLSVVAFIMFGLFSTLMIYDENAVLTRSYLESDATAILLGKEYRVTTTFEYFDGGKHDDESEEVYSSAYLTEKDISHYGDETFGAWSINRVHFNNAYVSSFGSNYDRYHNVSVSYIGYLPEGHPYREKIIAGHYPQAENEVLVSSYFFESMKHAEVYKLDENGDTTDERITITKESDLIGVQLAFRQIFVICGIFDCGTLPARYDPLKDARRDRDEMERLQNEFSVALDNGLYTCAFISEPMRNALAKNSKQEIELKNDDSYETAENEWVNTIGENGVWDSCDRLYTYSPEKTAVLFHGKTSVGDREILLPAHRLSEIFYKFYDEPNGENTEDYSEYYDAAAILTRESPESEEWQAAAKLYCDYFESHRVYYELQKSNDAKSYGQYELVGFFVEKNDDYWSSTLMGNENFVKEFAYRKRIKSTNYVPEEDAAYPVLFAPIKDKSDGGFRASLNGYAALRDNDTRLTPTGDIPNFVFTLSNVQGELSAVFLWVGIILTVFASLLLFNFISVSILNKKKEIGILRAVGARGTDVFKIFFAESGIIVGICIILSIIGTIALSAVINGIIRSNLGLPISIFVFGAVPIFFMLGIALFVAVVSTFLPVFFASRKKPVESIRAL